MNKYRLIIFLLLLASSVMGQKKTRIDLKSFSSIELMPSVNGKRVTKVRNGVFKHDNSILKSDSALFYREQNAFDAFGNVSINQGDTLNIYSDKLNYNGNTKNAILTNNVKLIDRDATLTTNYLTYNTGTRIGTYTGGGKLVDKDNVLVSKNGYYFASSRDAYFRYNVVCTTPDAIIKTDTMRYNARDKITYFYGPTHIYGKKDNDTLYTENGLYNTNTEQALFGKKNLYTQGTKSLKGDSLFYDRLKGYGRATRNVTFNDNEQKISIYGELGEFYKADDRAIITNRPYMIFVTEEKDTTKTAINNKLAMIVNTDSLSKKTVDSATVKLMGLTPAKTTTPPAKAVVVTKNSKSKTPAKAPTVALPKPFIAKAPENVKRDTLFMSADTIETQVLTFKNLKILKQERWEATHIDTSIKRRSPPITYKTLPKTLSLSAPKIPRDTNIFQRNIFGKPKPVAVVRKAVVAVKATPKLTKADSLKIKRKADSLELIANGGLRDTSRIRIVAAYHHAKIFKSDLQSVADSMFYSNSDSTIRSFGKPMMWTQGSQLSGDTINMQMKNKKLDNIDLFPAGFIVNIEKADSVHFNQLSGKKIHGVFKENKLSYMLVTGNAESRYFKRDSATNVVTDMGQSISGMLEATFKNGELKNVSFLQNAENRLTPVDKVKEEDKTLQNFIWKPKDRPVSKESILPPKSAKKVPAKPAAKPAAAKPPIKKPPVKKPALVSLNKNATVAKPSPVPVTRPDTLINKKN